MALAAAAGFFVARPGGGEEGRAALAGGLRLELPDGWRPTRPSSLPGLPLTPAVAAARGDGNTIRAGLARGSSPLDGPESLARRLNGRPRVDAVRSGEFEGYRVRGLTTATPARPVTLLVAPTSRGGLVAACVGLPGGRAVPAGCEGVAAGLSLTGAPALPLRGLNSYARAIGGTLRKLERRRRAGRGTLRRARTRRGQARAAASLAADHRVAARRLQRAHPPAALRDSNGRLVAALRRTYRAYVSLARAARLGNRSAYAGARPAIRRSEAGLARALRTLTRRS